MRLLLSDRRTTIPQGDHKGRPYNGRTGFRIIVGATLVVALGVVALRGLGSPL
jgi:hypothetical protein